jgi:hypothetical protein
MKRRSSRSRGRRRASGKSMARKVIRALKIGYRL